MTGKDGSARLELLHLVELAARGTWGLEDVRAACRLQFWLFMAELYLLEGGDRGSRLAEDALREVGAEDERRRGGVRW